MSAPDKSSLAVIYSSKSKSEVKVIFLVCIWNIRRRVFSSGRGNSIFRSILPIQHNQVKRIYIFVRPFTRTNECRIQGFNTICGHYYLQGTTSNIHAYSYLNVTTLASSVHTSTLLFTFTSCLESKPSNWFSNSNMVLCISFSPPEWLSYL